MRVGLALITIAREDEAMTRLFRRILVPHDFSDSATVALRAAAELAAGDGARLTVLHVLAPLYSGPAFPSEAAIAWTPSKELLADLRARLEMLVARALGRRARSVECRAVMGDPLQCILAAARRADSIVMATVGRTGLAHLLIGSVAEKVVRHSPVPVLTIRPGVRRRRGGTRGRAHPRPSARRP
jgi:nucleotide-binding universal stress UspA family protein